MRSGTENKASNRILSDHLSLKSKVKDPTHQQSSNSAETPMKPSQVTNRLSNPTTRRALPLQSPELYQKERRGSQNQLPHSRGSLYLPGQVPVSSARERTCPPQHFPQPTGLTCMSRMAPTTTATSDARTQSRPPVFSLPTSPQTRKDFNNHSVSSHLRSDQVCMSGGIGATVLGHKSNQDVHQNQTQSGELTQVDLNLLSLKRHRECEDFDSGSKKQRTQQAHAVKAQTPKPAAGEPLRTSLVSRPSLERSKVLGSTPNSRDGASHIQSSGVRYLNLDSRPTDRLPQSSKPYANTQPSTGARQALIKSSHTEIVKLTDIGLPSQSAEDNIMEKAEEKDKGAKSALSSDFTRKHKHVSRSRHHSSHSEHNTSDIAVKTTSRAKQTEDVRTSDSSAPKPSSKPASGSQSCRMAERNKMYRQRKPVVDDDIDQLFAPDPMTFIVNPVDKTVKLMKDVVKVKPVIPERSTSPGGASTSCTPLTASSCHKETRHTEKTQVHCSSSTPTVCLKRMKTKDLIPYRGSSVTSSSRRMKEDSVSSDSSSVSQCASPAQTSSTKQTSTSNQPPPALLERRASAEGRKQVSEVDSLDAELNLDLSLALDLDVTQTSHSSEEEELLSLQELMARVTKPAPATPVRGTFPLPSTPGHRGCSPKSHLPSCTAQTGVYKNNLDQMLKDIHTKKKAKEIETELLTACEEDRLRIAEYEEAEENQEEGISTEQQEFLQRYSLMSNAIREVPPGEVVFNLEKQGCIFNQNSLQLRQCMVNPQGTAQKTLLWSSPAGLRWHINCGLLQEAYDCHSPCPTQVTQFLFKMMSVHTERIVSEKILQALFDIANTAADQIVNNGNQQFKVWVPSLADVTLILMNMGVAFVSLFPFENLQPPFTEGDLLVNVYIRNEIPASNTEDNTFPEHNCNNVLKYLLHCMELCPKAYSDDELLLLLNVVGRVALDTQLILQCSIDLQTLQNKIINNFREWDTMLPRICSAFTDLTQDHHNMCLLVQWLPYNPRGKELRRHLSMSMISKLLDGSCKYRPTVNEFRLVVLRPYLSRMQPSALLRSMLSSSRRSNKDNDDVDMASLDKQSYYLCYSLLTLANEASNFQFIPVHQKEHLLILCSELETYVKCDIRESEKCLYRSKVKDLVARIYTKWQMLLQRTRPLHSKLYDYWKPLSANTVPQSPEMHAVDNSEEDETMTEEHPVTDEEESGVAGITSITGETEDDGADITGETEDDGADITGETEDDGADITGETEDDGADITGETEDDGADITEETDEDGTEINGEAEDEGANITGEAGDKQANITGKAEDKQADITGEANNEGAVFAGEAENEKGNITEGAVNEGAGVTEEAESEGPSNA